MGLNAQAMLWLTGLCLLLGPVLPAAFAAPLPPDAAAEVLEVEGKVEFLRAGANVWDRIQVVNPTNQFFLYPGDQLRTLAKSRAVVLMGQTRQRIGEYSYLRLDPKPEGGGIFRFFKGIYYFFHRDKPGQIHFETPTVSAVVRGTEFVVKVEENGTTTISLLDGQVALTNPFGELTLTTGQEGRAPPGQAPVRTAGLISVNTIQWCLYYPAVLHLPDLQLDPITKANLQASIQAYQAGDLLAAIEAYPENRQPPSPAEQVYHAGLLLSVGQVEEAQAEVNDLAPDTPAHVRECAQALQSLINAVKLIPSPPALAPNLASGWIAESYAHQANSNLDAALNAARAATQLAPNFSFAWARVAELEFSFGRRNSALTANTRALRLAPRNPQALTLKGFLLASDNRTREAIATFNQAIAIDGALGNAWLGRGLCQIRGGHDETGREDIQTAAALEPQRAFLRSYLGKAFSQTRDNLLAHHELDLAQGLDPADPTPWLYSALLKQRENQINNALTDLQHSQQLNNNRGVYRSRFLLDQDRAVRGVNLALLYQDAGMTEVSQRHAAEAVTLDYANDSAHFFLANSYNALRQNGRVDLRFETAALNEYLLGNLLAPPGAGTLSPQVSQQEFSRLFEKNRLGFVSHTEYLSRGDWTQSAAQYGVLGNSGYAVEGAYRSSTGQRPNNDLEQLSLSARFKQQLTPQDSLYIQTLYSDTETGDLSQSFFHTSDDVRIKETQEPIALVGLNHQWQPGSQTLFLAGRLQDTLRVNDPTYPLLLFAKDNAGNIIAGPLGLLDPTASAATPSLNYRSETEIYTTELQQLWQNNHHSLVAGARFQIGTFETHSVLMENNTSTLMANNATIFGQTQFRGGSTSTNISHDLERLSVYGYYTWNVLEPLAFTLGLSYDHLYYPENFRNSPIADVQQTREQLSPKLGLLWTPQADTALRAAYTRSLGGVSFDQSFRLEPSQVAGFNQAYRSLIPESAAGTLEAAHFETFSLALDQRFRSNTYLGAQFELLRSDGQRTLGTEELTPAFPPSSTLENLDYEERTLILTLNQLIGHHLSLGARYRLSHADLTRRFEEIPLSVIDPINDDVQAILHQVNLFAIVNHPSGLFSSVESLWSQQSNRGYTPDRPGNDFWHFNAFVGYRFHRRQIELKLGLLNITDQDYQINPLNLTPELPRDRTLAASLKLAF